MGRAYNFRREVSQHLPIFEFSGWCAWYQRKSQGAVEFFAHDTHSTGDGISSDGDSYVGNEGMVCWFEEDGFDVIVE